MHYRLEYKKSVKKEIRKLSQANRRAVVNKILSLRANPRPPGSVKLKGAGDLLRIRQGDYRIIYTVDDGVLVVIVVRIGHRGDIYHRTLP